MLRVQSNLLQHGNDHIMTFLLIGSQLMNIYGFPYDISYGHSGIQTCIRILEYHLHLLTVRQHIYLYFIFNVQDHLAVKCDLAAGGLFFFHQQLQKCGFSRSVISQQCDPVSSLHQQIDIRKQRAAFKAHAEIPKHHDLVPMELLLAEGGIHGLFLCGAFGFFNALNAALNAHGPAVEGAVVDAPALHALHGIGELSDLCLLLLILFELKLIPGLLFLHVEGIVAAVIFRLSAPEFHDPVYHLIQEIPVMGDGEHRALEFQQVFLQPLHAFHVQMVGGLVQQQNICLLQQ